MKPGSDSSRSCQVCIRYTCTCTCMYNDDYCMHVVAVPDSFLMFTEPKLAVMCEYVGVSFMYTCNVHVMYIYIHVHVHIIVRILRVYTQCIL